MNRSLFTTAKALSMLVLAGATLASGCGGSSGLVKYCCYQGEVVLTHLSDVKLVMADGKQRDFREVYTGFELQDRLFTTPLPLPQVTIADVIYQSLPPVLPLYDANNNGQLEPPEMTVMYIREGAIGLGHEVDHLAVKGEPARAITTSAADIGGLMTFINAHKDTFPPGSQAIFGDMERLGLDYIQRGSQGPDPSSKKLPP